MLQKYRNRDTATQIDPEMGTLGKFSINDRHFKIIILKSPSRDHQEITRFEVCGYTFAIVEDVCTAEFESKTRNMIAHLTGRELQIAAMIAQGDATKSVAYKLRISEWTVGTHLRRIFAKLGVDNRAAMVYRCASLIDTASQSPPKHQRPPASVD